MTSWQFQLRRILNSQCEFEYVRNLYSGFFFIIIIIFLIYYFFYITYIHYLYYTYTTYTCWVFYSTLQKD